MEVDGWEVGEDMMRFGYFCLWNCGCCRDTGDGIVTLLFMAQAMGQVKEWFACCHL
jgi:hypothetical protein